MVKEIIIYLCLREGKVGLDIVIEDVNHRLSVLLGHGFEGVAHTADPFVSAKKT